MLSSTSNFNIWSAGGSADLVSRLPNPANALPTTDLWVNATNPTIATINITSKIFLSTILPILSDTGFKLSYALSYAKILHKKDFWKKK